MPSLVHTCEHCGEHLPVAERYFGRPLRCPGCGTVFVVEAPTEGADSSLPETPAPPRWPRRWWCWLLPAVPAIGLVVWLSLPTTASNRLFSRQVFAGQVLAVTAPGSTAFGAIDHEQASVLVDLAGTRSLPPEPPPGAVRIEPGTRVSVVEHRRSERVVVARVLDGQWSGRVLWIPVEWLE
jgi:hypothetical protein